MTTTYQSSIPSVPVNSGLPCVLAKLAAIISTPPIESFFEELDFLESALSVLTHTKIPPGTITLNPQNDNVEETGLYEFS